MSSVKMNLGALKCTDGSVDYDRSQSDVFKYVEEHGGLVVAPNHYELQLDLDSEEAFAKFRNTLEILTDVMPALADATWTATTSGSGLPHRHVTVRLADGYVHDDHTRYLHHE